MATLTITQPDSVDEESDCESDKEFYDNLHSHISRNDISEYHSENESGRNHLSSLQAIQFLS